MSDSERQTFLERQVAFLEEERDAALEALDMAGDLASFAIASQERGNCPELLKDICSRANRMLPFRAISIYLANDETGDFDRALTDPPQAAGELDDEIRALIADYSFSHALQANDNTFFLSGDKSHHILLRPLKTNFRVLGMFVGGLAERKDRISDIALRLFAVVMQAAAHAMENQDMHRAMENYARELDDKVKQRTAELEEAYERLCTTIDGMQAGVLLVEPKTRIILDANPQTLRMVGLSHDELVGKPCSGCFCPTPEPTCPVLDMGQTMTNQERTMRTASGETIPILKTVSKVMINGREHLLESFIDITEQKKLETLREDVDRIMRHDLKGPLNGIIGLPAMILAAGDNLTDDQREGLRFIREAGNKLLRMINMSLDLYKMETGSYVYTPGENDIMAIVGGVARDQQDNLRASGVRLRITLEGRNVPGSTKLPFACEESLLYSMLSNLAKNAVEGSRLGGEVILNIQRTQDAVILTMHNSKPVPEAIRCNVFEKYVTEGKKRGTGLGTYSARLIAEAMGGSIACKSSEESGTTMTVMLPDPKKR
ncbi:ATP-binding protein [Pseudodesulfovibrio sp.]|uniref:sensor histidine kinase n=1 Tax=unclassified Pseudodesulfovibrio TaxID=2661612 RepID=UPI003B00D9B2